ncbi:MAG: GNAT family N-acetyltransferase [Chloroflexi bacterium]|nr:GNAT family N-acetyltransferase [Chloroflexota bacterium]
MMENIRLFDPSEAEYEAIFAIEQAVWPENPTTVTEFKHADASKKPTEFKQRFVVERNGRLVAFAPVGQVTWASDDGRYRMNITVHPDFERQGIGTAVYEHILTILHQRTPKPLILESGTYQHKPQSIQFLKKRGFRQVMRWIISTLAVPNFDVNQFIALRQKIADQEIEIRSLSAQKPLDPNWQQNLWELDWALTLDEPLPYEPKKVPFADYVQKFIHEPGAVHEAWFVALADGRYVGMSQLMISEIDPTLMFTGFTGVIRSHRCRGLATVLKTVAIEYAQNKGIQLIRTGNEESNPMYTLNRKLGFTDLTATLAFEKAVANNDSEMKIR